MILALFACLACAQVPERVFEGAGERVDVPAVLAALPKELRSERRAELVRFLGRADLGAHELTARIGSLERLALQDPALEVRRRAVDALAQTWQREAWEHLDGLLDRADAGLRPLIARALAERARLAPRIVARVLAAAQSGHEDPRVFAPLLAAYGRALADEPHGGERVEERAVLVAAGRDSDPEVALAARAASEELFGRLRTLVEPERVDQLARAFAIEGAEPAWCAAQRVQTALLVGKDAEPALAAARELVALAERAEERERPLLLARARVLESISLLALDRPADAEAPAREAARLVARALEEIAMPSTRARFLQEARLDELGARAELALLLARLARSPAGTASTEAIASAVELQRWALRWQLASLRARAERTTTLDALLADGDSPLTLLVDNPWRKGFDHARGVELEERLGRTLASVAARELPGFAPWPGVAAEAADPLQDPRRAPLYEAILAEETELVQEQLTRELGRALGAARADPLGLSPADERRLIELESSQSQRAEEQAAVRQGKRERLRELRAPSALSLDLARTLRDEGRPADARSLAEALEAALKLDPAAQRFLWGVELQAECEALRGNTWTDSGEPTQAEVELLRALERLEALEKELTDRGVSWASLARLRSTRAGVLVSLAVNANVKLHDQPKALAYFERGWELRQDEFMKALRACYLARAARADEARALLREIVPSPATLYNLACTWALLGEKETALAFLERDFDENLPSPGMRAKQQGWAKGDPDLASLRGEARFERLLAQ